MFRVLSTEELNHVKKWQAPRLSKSDRPSNPLAGLASQSLDEDEKAADITNIRKVVAEAQGNKQTSADENTIAQEQANGAGRSHASLAMSNPSADMLQQSYDEGFSAGVQAVESQTDQLKAETLLNLLADLASEKYQIDVEIEQELVSLAKAIAKMLLQREVETDDGVIFDIVKRALAKMPMLAEPPTVHLNPIDLNAVQQMQTSPILATLIPDTKLNRGDCRIESGASILEAGIDALIESISSTSQTVRSHSHDGDTTSVDTEKVNI